MGWIKGFEPLASRATIWRANQLRYTHHIGQVLTLNVLEGIRTPDPRLRRPLLYPAELQTQKKHVMRIELTYSAWKADVLPLNHTCINIGVTGFEPAASWSQTRRSSQTEPHPDVLSFCHFLNDKIYSITRITICQQLFEK